MKSAIIIGGGFAGLAAGVALARKKTPLTLLEQRRILGGRAYSIPDGQSGEWVDNGQHAFLAAFKETRRFLSDLGTDSLVRYQERFRICMIEPGGRKILVQGLPLPSPLHLGLGILLSTGLSWSHRIHLLRAGISIGLTQSLPTNMTVCQWLDAMRQPESLRKRWWYPLSTAALNEQPEKASAGMFLNVLKLAFFGRAKDSSFGIMTVSLGDLYTDQAKNIILSNKGTVNLNAGVRRIHIHDQRVTGVELLNGSQLQADCYISSVPPWVLKRLLPRKLTENGAPFSFLDRFSESPILSVHLWFDRNVMEEDFIGLVDSPIHWVFNKSQLWQEGKSKSGALACVVSGAYDLIDRPREELIALTLSELKRFLPNIDQAKLQHSRLIKERHATYSCTPMAEISRPDQKTPISNLFLAGDWTRTGLPPTIEGAVKSGHRCARLIVDIFGDSQ